MTGQGMENFSCKHVNLFYLVNSVFQLDKITSKIVDINVNIIII